MSGDGVVTINGQRAELVTFPGPREYSTIIAFEDGHKLELRTIIQKVYRLEAPGPEGLPAYAVMTAQVQSTLA